MLPLLQTPYLPGDTLCTRIHFLLGKGDDTLGEGNDADTFAYRSDFYGDDIVLDFHQGECARLDLRAAGWKGKTLTLSEDGPQAHGNWL